MHDRDDSFHGHMGIARDSSEMGGKSFDESSSAHMLLPIHANLYKNHSARVQCMIWHYPCILEFKRPDFNNDGNVFDGPLNIKIYRKRCQYEGGKICSRI
jgi:hypothetical protein